MLLKLFFNINGSNNQIGCWDDTITVSQLKKLPQTLERDIVLTFLEERYLLYSLESKKRIMQALRHFDEVGICNDLWEGLDMISSANYFYLSGNQELPSDCTLIYDIEDFVYEKIY